MDGALLLNNLLCDLISLIKVRLLTEASVDGGFMGEQAAAENKKLSV